MDMGTLNSHLIEERPGDSQLSSQGVDAYFLRTAILSNETNFSSLKHCEEGISNAVGRRHRIWFGRTDEKQFIYPGHRRLP